MPKVVFCVPVVSRPHPMWLKSLEECLPVIEAAGWEHGLSQVVDNPYISCARADMLRQALNAKADVVVFTDYDVAWRPGDMLKLLETEGDVVGGTYRFKYADRDEEYMGGLERTTTGSPVVRADGCVSAEAIPAGFLKVSRAAVGRFMKAYPELVYGDPTAPHVDLFNHGARDGLWWGEDYAFSDRWKLIGGDLWVVPNLNIDHYAGDVCYPGNFHKYLIRITGSKEEGMKKKKAVVKKKTAYAPKPTVKMTDGLKKGSSK